MRYIFTILIFSISFLTFGQKGNDITVRINREPLDSLPKFVIKMDKTEYLLDSISNSQMDSDSVRVVKIVNNFFDWYIEVTKTNNSIEFMPQFVENDRGMTTLDFSRYFENLRKYQFCNSLIESERLTYEECISHIEKVKYSDFKTLWTDLDDFESTNCDFANSYRWTGGMEPIDCIRIVDLKKLSNHTCLIQLQFCRIDPNDKEYFWGKRTVTLEKHNNNWRIIKID